MAFEKEDEGPFRVIRWCPGIRGIRSWFDLRTMTRDGKLWFAAQDVQKALGLTKRAFHERRVERLEGNTWGTTRAQWQGRGPQLLFINLTALTVVMAKRHNRVDRFFLRWLDSLEDVAEQVDARDFGVDLPTDADHAPISSPAAESCRRVLTHC